MTTGIIAAFFGAAFLIALLTAARFDKYLQKQSGRRPDEGRRQARKLIEVVTAVPVVEPRPAPAEPVRRKSMHNEYDLPDAAETLCPQRARLEMIPFGSPVFHKPYDSPDSGSWLTPARTNHVPLITALTRRRRVDLAVLSDEAGSQNDEALTA